MRKFIIQCVCFLLPLLVVAGVAEMYMRHLPNSYQQKETWMQAHASEVEVLILGNSHGLFGLRPDCMSSRKTYNLCQVSQIFEYDEYLLKRYAPKLKKLREVILIADNSNLFDAPLEQTEWFRCIYYRLYMDYPKHSLWSKYGFELSNVQAAWQKFLAGKSDCDSLGWNRSYAQAKRSEESFTEQEIENAIRHHHCKDWAVANSNLVTLRRIAEWCHEHQIRLLLVQAPVTNDYYRRIDKRQRHFIKSLSLIPYVQILDYSDDKRFNDHDFFDADHLTDEGARKWSEMINNTIL